MMVTHRSGMTDRNKRCVQSQIQAQEIEVGDLVWLHENDEIPCDLVLLGTAESIGLCYIEVSFK